MPARMSGSSIAGHGVPEPLIDRAFAASRGFHGLPLDEKLKLRLNENNIGYLPINASVQGASTVHKATRPNQNESFFVSHDRGPDHPDVAAGKPLRGCNQWPPETIPGIAEMRRDMMAYFHALSAMCDRILPAFAAALDMPSDFFAPFFENEAHANMLASCTTRRRPPEKKICSVRGRTPTTAS